MMFLRHGMFARKSAVERHRKLIIGGAIGLLLVITAVIYAVVKAAGSFNLGYTDASNKGLTSGNITGTLTKTDNSAATDVDRDGQVKLTLEFNFTDDVVEDAKNATAWTYDLNSAVGSSSANPFVSSVVNIDAADRVPIVNDNVIIAYYTVNNNVVTVTPETTTAATDWWTTHTTNIEASLSLTLNLDKVSVGTNSQDTFVLPGTQTDTNPSGNSTNAVVYDTPHISIHEYVYDEGSQSFKAGDYDKLIDVEELGGDYIATYNTNFYTDVYTPDLKVTIALSGDQTFDTSAGLVMKTCTTNNCIHDSGATTIAIPATYIAYSADNKTAEIDMEGFLYDYCEVGGHDCTSAGIYGYTLNDPMNANNANGSDYYIQYKANLGSTDPAGNGKTYSTTATITGNSGALLATDTVRYGAGIPGSKTGTCVSGSTSSNGTTTCNEDENGDIFIDYVVKVGETGTDLSKTTITDEITDNQVLEGDITLISPSGATTTIAKATSCASDSDNDCIVSAAIDTNYSTNTQKLFSHAFGAGDVGEWTVSYRVKIAKDAVIGGSNVDNKIDLTLDQTTYYDVWKTSTHYEFATPMYIEKVEDRTLAADGIAYWTITVYGPTSGSLQNVVVTDTLRYDKSKFSQGSIATTVESASKIANNTTTSVSLNNEYTVSADINGNLVINISEINAGEVYAFSIKTQADDTFKTAYAGKTVDLQNQACRVVQIGSNPDSRCSSQVHTNILTPNAEVVEKTAAEDSQVFYWALNQNGDGYAYGTRKGYVWTVTINSNAGSIADTTSRANDYEPYFTDIIPDGMYLTYKYNQNGKAAPGCQTAGACDASVDIDQSKYYTSIEVRRKIPSIAGTNEEYRQIVDVEVVNGVIQPVNLAAVFNEDCTIPSGANPTMTCAGINGAIYTVTYATTLADDVYNDYANAHTFTNQAKLNEKVVNEQNPDGVYVERDNASATVTYQNASVIEKSDPTAQTLGPTSKITYVITVNKAGYAYLNNGEAYESGTTRPMLTVTDVIPSDVNILTTAFSAENLVYGYNSVSGSSPIVCTDINDTAVNDCSFSYESNTRVLTAQVPDGLVRKIWYSVIVANPIPNNSSDYTNTAVLQTPNTDFSSTVTKNHIIDGNVGYISGNGLMKIKKVNANNLSEAVQGAEFKLVQVAYDASTGALGTETEIDLNGSTEGNYGTTSNAGEIQFSNLCGYSTGVNASCPDGGQLYYWQEVSVPAPYIPDGEMTKHYFMLYDSASSKNAIDANEAIAQAAANIIEENGNNHFTVEVLNSSYEWIVTNIKQEETSIAIEKKVSGNTARVEDVFTITITATDLAGEPLEGSYPVYVYELEDRADITLGEPLVFDENGIASRFLNHGQGILIDGVYVGGTYEITESNNTGYEVSYICSDLSGDGCASATSNTGTFVADTNTGVYPTVVNVGQTVTLVNDSSTEITGISSKKPSVAIAIIFGSTVAGLGIFIARKFRH